jgi:hypothetical protein
MHAKKIGCNRKDVDVPRVLKIYVADFKHLMSETSNDLKALTHLSMTIMVMICLLTFHMKIISIFNNNGKINIYMKQINHKTNMEFE